MVRARSGYVGINIITSQDLSPHSRRVLVQTMHSIPDVGVVLEVGLGISFVRSFVTVSSFSVRVHG